MTLFGDYYFFSVAVVLLIPAIIMGLMQKNIKYYGFIITLVFIYLALGSYPVAMLNLALYCLFELVLVKSYLAIVKKHGRNYKIYLAFLTLSLVPLIVWKITAFEGFNKGHGLLAFLGLSYMTFKTAQMIIEIYDNLISEVNIFEFIYFLIFFPCLSSGPIDRSRRFHKDMANVPTRSEYIELLGNGIYKIFIGLFYKFVCAVAMYQAMIWLGDNGESSHLWNHLLYMYSYGFYLFFDFAGYSLMAIGVSYILGVRTPENFNKPFISKDMKEFWDRWHMTLSYWFRDFIFSRFMMKSIKNKWFKNKLTGASVGFIIDMGIMGVWHGLDIYYIMYGLYHGVLLSATEVYQKKSKFHKTYKKEGWYRTMSWFITFNLAMFGFFIFSGRFTSLLELS